MSNNEVKKRSNTEFSSRFDGFSTSSLEIPCSILDIRFRFPSFFSPFSTADGSKKWEGIEAETCPVFYGPVPQQAQMAGEPRAIPRGIFLRHAAVLSHFQTSQLTSLNEQLCCHLTP